MAGSCALHFRLIRPKLRMEQPGFKLSPSRCSLASVYYEFHVQSTYSIHNVYFYNVEIAWCFFLDALSCFLNPFKVLSVEEKCITRSSFLLQRSSLRSKRSRTTRTKFGPREGVFSFPSPTPVLPPFCSRPIFRAARISFASFGNTCYAGYRKGVNVLAEYSYTD